MPNPTPEYQTVPPEEWVLLYDPHSGISYPVRVEDTTAANGSTVYFRGEPKPEWGTRDLLIAFFMGGKA